MSIMQAVLCHNIQVNFMWINNMNEYYILWRGGIVVSTSKPSVSKNGARFEVDNGAKF